MVASDNIALFVHTPTAVGITIVSKANIQMIFHNKLLNSFNLGRAGICVDVRAIRLVVNDMSWVVGHLGDREWPAEADYRVHREPDHDGAV